MENNIAKNILYIINSTGLSKDEIEKIFTLEKGDLDKYISGETSPDYTVIMKFCRCFKISPDSFNRHEISDGYENRGLKLEIDTERMSDTENQIFFKIENSKNKDLEKEISNLKKQLKDCENQK